MERRLAAIMATDVVGYSRLIRSDEEGTLAALKALRADLIDPKIAEHHGRVVKLMGDGMLAEFASAVDPLVFRKTSGSRSASGSIWATWWSTAMTSTETGSTWPQCWKG